MVSATPPSLPVSGGDRDVWGPKLNSYLQCGADSITALNLLKTIRGPVSVSGAVTVNFALAGVHFLDLTGNVTSMTLQNIPDGGSSVQIWVRQSGSGNYTVAWPASIHWPGGNVAPVVTANLGRVDLYTFTVYSGLLYNTAQSKGLL